MEKPELLAPCGDLECLKAAVQNGADSVYLGTSGFNARARATNFDYSTLAEAIKYAKLRNVRVHVTLNILIKNEEFEDAVKLALDVYDLGADALIIQDLGLLQYLLKNYPEIPIHASTQMTTHNLAGVQQLENMGVSRVVLSRELSINEIKNICQNSNVEIETFIHGALCVSYSGQCLFSSIIGGRSGNRGLCAQPCRLPYTLIDEKNTILDKGHLLSPRDLNGINYLPELIRAGVKCFKIEGRLKSPEYVGVITKFYRKYIDIVLDNGNLSNEQILEKIFKEVNRKNETTDMTDLEEITQVFNRGGFSSGHFADTANRELVFQDKPNNSGFYLGKIEKFNPSKGYITLKTFVSVGIGDKIGINSDTYTVSELMIHGNNIRKSNVSDVVTIGRINGNIKPGLKVYRLQSKVLNDYIAPTFKENKELKKLSLCSKIYIQKNSPIKMEIYCDDKNSIYFGETISVTSSVIPSQALTNPTSKEKIISQISKTGNTPFVFKDIDLVLDDDLFIPISSLNEIRRTALEKLMNTIIDKEICSRKLVFKPLSDNTSTLTKCITPKINLLLNILNPNFNYSILSGFDRLFVPLKYFLLPDFNESLKMLCNKFNTYVYMPSILRDTIHLDFDNIVSTFKLKGFVLSSLSQFEILRKYNLELLGNYTLNVYNSYTIENLRNKGISEVCITPELNDLDTKNLIAHSSIPLELMVYGRIPFMTMNYCLLGKSNKCYSSCDKLCNSNHKFYIRDRLGLDFRIVPDNISTITTIYNSKITSFDYSHFHAYSVRISILDEEPNRIQEIINTVKSSKRFEGSEFCKHFNKK